MCALAQFYPGGQILTGMLCNIKRGVTYVSKIVHENQRHCCTTSTSAMGMHPCGLCRAIFWPILVDGDESQSKWLDNKQH